MNVFVLIGPDDEVLSVHSTARRAQRKAEKREGRTLAWGESIDPQYHREAEDYRVAQVPADLAPKPGRARGLRVID